MSQRWIGSAMVANGALSTLNILSTLRSLHP
jgi:hypothetical protein